MSVGNGESERSAHKSTSLAESLSLRHLTLARGTWSEDESCCCCCCAAAAVAASELTADCAERACQSADQHNTHTRAEQTRCLSHCVSARLLLPLPSLTLQLLLL